MTDQQDKVLALEVLLPNLSAKDKEFAASLVKQGKAKPLSFKQLYWVDKLIASAKGEKPAAETVELGSFAGLVALFQKAKKTLKFPKLFLSVNKVPVVVSIAGEKSKAPGSINVAGEGAFYERPWYGRVSPDGTWTKSFKQYSEQAEVESLLKALAVNPSKAAKEFGKLSGCCCFCGKQLTDEKSTAAGFGQTCAKNWGLLAEWKSATATLSDAEVEDLVSKAEQSEAVALLEEAEAA